MRSEFRKWAGIVLVVLATFSAAGQTNGIFADFTTSLGTFTCQLSYSNAPKSVANFIALATGQRPWLDLVTGQARTEPFYDGQIFHRVISNFVDQAGSPNRSGTDGPGYAVVDEFNALLNFNAPWVLAMANSGPDSNGSQFFITVAPFTSGNNTYTVFGRVVSGTNVVAAINHVATDANDKPKTNVVIQQVTIRREGTAAEAFDINAYGLPLVTNIPAAISPTATGMSLTFSNRIYSDNLWYGSTNLNSWTVHSLGVEIATPTSNTVQVVKDAPQKFFRFAQVQYATPLLTPKDVLGRKLVLVFPGLGTNTITFNTSGGGTYNFPGYGTGTVTSYTWTQDPYRGLLWPISFSALNQMTLHLEFSTAQAGSFAGTVYGFFSSPVSGTFRLTGP